jgi:branched-chain amino acid transport system substrate-binding protein
MHKKKKWTWIIVMSLFLALAFVGGSAAAEKVKIALFVILSGSGADLGEQSRNGAELALEDINNSGGIKALGGAKLELVVADVTTTYSKGPNITERVLSTNDVAGAIGYGYSGMTLACLPVIEKAKIPLVTTSISNEITAQGYKYVFEICPKGTQFGETQVKFAAWLRDNKKMHVEKVGFVFENGPYGTSTAEGLKKGAQEVGFENIVLYQPYDKDITDAAPLVTKIKASGADVLFATSYTPDAQLLVSTMKAMRVTPVLIGGGAGFCWPPIQQSIGEKVNGIFSVGSWSWDTKNIVQVPERLEVTRRYEERFGTFMPEPGVIAFDETGWNHHTFPTMIQWQDQKPTTVYPESVATSEVVWPIQ